MTIEADTEAPELGWLGPVYDQDTGNLDAQQKGFKTSGRGAGTLGNYQESRIRRINLTLDEFMGTNCTSPKFVSSTSISATPPTTRAC